MARFYKTASVAPMDYMYQMNIPLMQQAIQANELGVNQEIQSANQLEQLAAKFPYLTPDSQRAAEITSDYAKQVDSITKAIQQDPTNWRKQKTNISNIARNLQQNYATGEISKIAGNYAKYKELDDYITEREKAGKVTPYEGAAFRSKALESLKDGTGFDSKTGIYKQINTVKPIDTINVRDRLQKMIDNKKASGDLKWDEQAGQYILKTTRGYEGVKAEDLIPIMVQGLQGDTELMQYLKQRSDFGLMSGVFDKNGRFINPYVSSPAPINDVEKAQLTALQKQINSLRSTDPAQAERLQQQFDNASARLATRKRIEGNPESSLYPTINSLAGEMSYEKTKEGIDLKNNSLYNLQVTQAFQGKQKALDRALKEDQFQRNMKQKEDFFNKKMLFDKYKFDNPVSKSKTTAKDKTGKDIINPTESVVGQISVNPFHNDDYYSSTGLSNAIVSGKSNLAKLDSQIGQYDTELQKVLNGRDYHSLSPSERGKFDSLMKAKTDLENAKESGSMSLDNSRALYAQADTWAIEGRENGKANLTEGEKRLYKQYALNRGMYDRLGSEVSEFEKKPVRGTVPESRARFLGPNDYRTPAEQNMIDLYKGMTQAKDRVSILRNRYLNDARQNTTVEAPSVEFGTEDNKFISNLMSGADIKGLDLFDIRGNKGPEIFKTLDAKGLSIDPKADNFAAVFGGDRNLMDYLNKEGGKIKVMGVSPSVAFDQGSKGGVLRIRFEKADGSKGNVGDLPSDKDYFVSLTPQLQMKIGEKLSANKSKDVSDIGKLLLDQRNQAIRNAFLDVRNHVDPKTGEMGAKKIVRIPYSGGTAKFNVRSYLNNITGDYDYYVTMTNKTGEEIPVRNPLSKDPVTGEAKAGFFDSIDHFQQALDINVSENKFY